MPVVINKRVEGGGQNIADSELFLVLCVNFYSNIGAP